MKSAYRTPQLTAVGVLRDVTSSRSGGYGGSSNQSRSFRSGGGGGGGFFKRLFKFKF